MKFSNEPKPKRKQLKYRPDHFKRYHHKRVAEGKTLAQANKEIRAEDAADLEAQRIAEQERVKKEAEYRESVAQLRIAEQWERADALRQRKIAALRAKKPKPEPKPEPISTEEQVRATANYWMKRKSA